MIVVSNGRRHYTIVLALLVLLVLALALMLVLSPAPGTPLSGKSAGGEQTGVCPLTGTADCPLAEPAPAPSEARLF